MSWSVSGENKTRGYNFTYDNLSRLTGAGYLENGNANDRFNTSYAYDKHGNMTQLSRRGNTGTTTYGLIDNLSMTYAGNQLVKTEDTGSSVTLSRSMDFKNNANLATEYLYDKNGNLIKDYNKSITEISYNVLNLPQTLKISSATNTYTYAADGRKLKTVLGGSKTTDYCGNVIYENGLLKRILVDGGYIENGTYYFYLTDHLGNNRVIASSSGSIVQSNHYYPFGMSFTEGSATSQQPYKYNGKELDTERGLNLYDYSARYMDPALGRFSTVDPHAEKYYSWSPYHYAANNPIMIIDPNGKDWYKDEKGNVLWREGNGDIEGYKNIGASYTMDIGNGISITYTQIDATSMTFTGAKESSWESQITNGTNCYQASSEMLQNEGVETAGRGTEVLVTGTAANGRAGDANANASTGFAVIDQALENGNPIIIGVDYTNGSPNVDGKTDHFIVVSSKTETLKNGAVTSTTYNYFDPRTSHQKYGTSSNNQLTISNNKMTGSYNHGGSKYNYTVTTVRRNR